MIVLPSSAQVRTEEEMEAAVAEATGDMSARTCLIEVIQRVLLVVVYVNGMHERTEPWVSPRDIL